MLSSWRLEFSYFRLEFSKVMSLVTWAEDFKVRVLRKIFGAERDKVTWEWTILHN